jgi:Sporulation and spore germination
MTLYFSHGASGELEPVARDSGATTPRNVVAGLLRGPSASERRNGLRPVIYARFRAFSVAVHGGTAVVDYSGAELGFSGAAALVFSLTELSGVEGVSLRRDGRSCCVYDHDGQVIDPLTRSLYRGWSREPCALRTYPDAVPCRG